MLSSLFKPRRPCILFVCTANLCRSPMAEGICRSLVREQGHDWEIISAGFFVDRPIPPHEGTLAVLSKHQIAINDLESTRLTPKLLRRATHIFTMTEMHLVSLRKQEAKTRDRAHLITAFSTDPSQRNQDLSDPIDGGPKAFEETYRILADAMPQIIRFVEGRA
jgi:protein-tyrosine phosphatase